MRSARVRRSGEGRRAIGLLVALVLTFPVVGTAAEAPPLGFADRAPSVDAERGTLFSDAVGWADGRIGRWEARRADARMRAEARAREALHAYVDARLARSLASPRAAAAVHEVIEMAAMEVARRPLVDGGSVVRLEVPLARLRVAARPWELAL